jgi:hypothetical protein
MFFISYIGGKIMSDDELIACNIINDKQKEKINDEGKKSKGKSLLDRATWAYLLGWIPIYFIVGYIVYILGWNKTYPLIDLLIAFIIFLIFVVPLVAHLEKKSQ